MASKSSTLSRQSQQRKRNESRRRLRERLGGTLQTGVIHGAKLHIESDYETLKFKIPLNTQYSQEGGTPASQDHAFVMMTEEGLPDWETLTRV